MGSQTSRPRSGQEVPQIEYIEDVVSKDCIIVFSKTNCLYCKKVKKLFEEQKLPYTCIELNERSDGLQLQNALSHMTGARTVPRVFINNECIGGASDVEQLFVQGKLFELIDQCKLKQEL